MALALITNNSSVGVWHSIPTYDTCRMCRGTGSLMQYREQPVSFTSFADVTAAPEIERVECQRCAGNGMRPETIWSAQPYDMEHARFVRKVKAYTGPDTPWIHDPATQRVIVWDDEADAIQTVKHTAAVVEYDGDEPWILMRQLEDRAHGRTRQFLTTNSYGIPITREGIEAELKRLAVDEYI